MSVLSPEVKKHVAHISAKKLDGTGAGAETRYWATKELAEQFIQERLEHYQSQGATIIRYYFGELNEEHTVELRWVHTKADEPIASKKTKPKTETKPTVEI